jgi:hypothetical protein
MKLLFSIIVFIGQFGLCFSQIPDDKFLPNDFGSREFIKNHRVDSIIITTHSDEDPTVLQSRYYVFDTLGSPLHIVTLINNKIKVAESLFFYNKNDQLIQQIERSWIDGILY